jgi:hypothetical protein
MLIKMKGSNNFSLTNEMKIDLKMMKIKMMMIQIKHCYTIKIYLLSFNNALCFVY